MNWPLVLAITVSQLYVLMIGVFIGGLATGYKEELEKARDWPWWVRLCLVVSVLFWPVSVFFGWLLWDERFWQRYRRTHGDGQVHIVRCRDGEVKSKKQPSSLRVPPDCIGQANRRMRVFDLAGRRCERGTGAKRA